MEINIDTFHIKRSKVLPREALTHYLKAYDTSISAFSTYSQSYPNRLRTARKRFVTTPCLTTFAIGSITLCTRAGRFVLRNRSTQNLFCSIAKPVALLGVVCASVALIGEFFARKKLTNDLRDLNRIINKQRAKVIAKFDKRARFIGNAGELQGFIGNNDHYANAAATTLAQELKNKATEHLETWAQFRYF